MRYNHYKGIVQNRSASTVEIRLSPKDQYSSCSAKGCNLCAAPSKSLIVVVPLKNAEFCENGESVVVSLPAINEAIAAVIVFLVPLVVAAAVAWILNSLCHISLESGRAILIILASFIFGFAIPIGIDRVIKKKFPIVVAKQGESC